MNPKWRSLEIMRGALGDIGESVTGYIANKRAADELEAKHKAFIQYHNTEIARPENKEALAGGNIPDAEGLWELSAHNPAAAMGALHQELAGRRPAYSTVAGGQGSHALVKTLPGQRPVVEQQDFIKGVGVPRAAALVVGGYEINSPEEAMAIKAALPKDHPEIPKIDSYLAESKQRALEIAKAGAQIRESVTIAGEARKGAVERAGAHGERMTKMQDDILDAEAAIKGFRASKEYGGREKMRLQKIAAQEELVKGKKAAWVDAYEKLEAENPKSLTMKDRSQYIKWKAELQEAVDPILQHLKQDEANRFNITVIK